MLYTAGWMRPRFNQGWAVAEGGGMAVCGIASDISDHSTPQGLRSLQAIMPALGLQMEEVTALEGPCRPDHLWPLPPQQEQPQQARQPSVWQIQRLAYAEARARAN